MKSKLLAAFIFILLVLMLCAGAQAVTGNCGVVDDTNDGSGLTWSLASDGSLYIYYNHGTGEMQEAAFRGWENITSVTIYKGVTKISADAFRACDNLTKVTFYGDSVTTIGRYSFGFCEALESITIPDSVTVIEDIAFDGCYSLKTVNLPKKLTSIGEHAFLSCYSLESITIPDSVTVLDGTFDGCYSLKTVNLPKNLKVIGESAFEFCESLESIDIPDSVTEIGYQAFRRCISLRDIHLPANLTMIDAGAFRGCSSLTNIILPAKVTSIGGLAFEECTSLESIVIPAGVTVIEESCFRGCTSLASVTLPSGLKTIEEFAFEETDALTQIAIPDGVTKVDSLAFSLGGMKTFCCTPGSSGYATIKNTFAGKSYNICFGHGDCGDDMHWQLWENGQLSISGSGAMYDYSFSGNRAPWYSLSRYIKQVLFPMYPEITHLGAYAFYGLSGVTEVYLPKSLQSMGEGCFRECSGLDHAIFNSSSFESIPDYAFFRCYALENVTLPESCPTIGNYAFSECVALTTVDQPKDLETIGTCSFLFCYNLKDLKLNSVTDIGSMAFASCYGLESVELSGFVASIADDAFTNTLPTFVCHKYSDFYEYAKACGFEVEYLPALALPENTKTVEDRAFFGTDVGMVIIPEGCESIRNFAFSNCDNLYRVVILGSDTDIASGAFFATSGFVISAPEGSYAQTFAAGNGIPFDAL